MKACGLAALRTAGEASSTILRATSRMPVAPGLSSSLGSHYSHGLVQSISCAAGEFRDGQEPRAGIETRKVLHATYRPQHLGHNIRRTGTKASQNVPSTSTSILPAMAPSPKADPHHLARKLKGANDPTSVLDVFFQTNVGLEPLVTLGRATAILLRTNDRHFFTSRPLLISTIAEKAHKIAEELHHRQRNLRWSGPSPLETLDLLVTQWNVFHPDTHPALPLMNLEDVEPLYRMVLILARHVPLQILWNSTLAPSEARLSLIVEAYSTPLEWATALKTFWRGMDRGAQVRPTSRSLLVRALLEADLPQEAAPIVAKLPPTNRTVADWEAALALAAYQGSARTARSCFEALDSALQEPRDVHVAWLLEAEAKEEGADAADHLFWEYFKVGSGRQASAIHFNAMLRAHASEGDLDGMQKWFADAQRHGLGVDPSTYEELLRPLAMRQDLEDIRKLLRTMDTRGIPRTRTIYHILVKMCADRRDPGSAQQLIRRAEQDGFELDGKFIQSYIGALIAAGSWAGVIHALVYVGRQPSLLKRFPNNIAEARLKAFAFADMPFETLIQARVDMGRQNLRPSVEVYHWLIRSALHQSVPSWAQLVYRSLVNKAQDPSKGIVFDGTAAVMMMDGYLRSGELRSAVAVFNDIWDREFPVTTQLLKTSLKAYGEKLTKGSLAYGEDLVAEMLKEEEGRPRKAAWRAETALSPNPLEDILTPLMQAHAELHHPKHVVRHLEPLASVGRKPSLASLTILLDAYRRLGRVRAAKSVWHRLFTEAVYESSNPIMAAITGPPQTRTLSRHALAQPLSIVIDALSAEGAHDEIPRLWKEVQAAGFVFSSDNWNDLVVASIRAGRVDHAFQIVQEIILPRRDQQWKDFKAQQTQSSSLFLPELGASLGMDGADGRAVFRHYFLSPKTRNQLKRTRRFFSGNGSKKERRRLEVKEPLLQYWPLKEQTIMALKGALGRLRQGDPIMPACPTGQGVQDPSQGSKARALLASIQSRYPDAVRRVRVPLPRPREAFCQWPQPDVNAATSSRPRPKVQSAANTGTQVPESSKMGASE